MEHQNLDKSNKVCYLKEAALFLLVIGIVTKNCRTRKLLLLPCMYRYTFNFKLKLANTPLQKLATFYMFNEKQKDDGMDQNTFPCFYGDYVTTSQ